MGLILKKVSKKRNIDPLHGFNVGKIISDNFKMLILL